MGKPDEDDASDSRLARVALVTAGELAHLDDDLAPVVAGAEARAVTAEIVDWHDDAFDWTSVELAVIRSTWDYTWQLDAFLAWAARVDELTSLVNPLGVLRWNTDKRYLVALDAEGVPVVPTELVEPGESTNLTTAGELVVKPVVSAGARDTERYPPDRLDEAHAHVESLQASGRAALVQPYLAAIDEQGETGMVFIDDEFSHAFRKAPILRPDTEFVEGLYRAEDISPRRPSTAERDVAEAALDAVGRCVPGVGRADLLFARVDVAPGDDGPLLLELELVEPSLFCSVSPGSAGRLAHAIATRVSP